MLTRPDWDTIDGVVLDAVGTLIEPFPSVAEVYAAAAQRQGIALSVDEVKTRFVTHFRNDEWDEIRGPLVTDETTEHRRWRRIVANVLPEVPDGDRAFEELWHHFGSAAAWHCFADVEPAIDVLQASNRAVCVASNFDGRLRQVVAGLEPLRGVRDRLVISSEVGCRKPHPDFYRAACALLGLPPDRVLCVGDDPDNDVAGAARAGCRGLLIARRSANSTNGLGIRSLAELLVGL